MGLISRVSSRTYRKFTFISMNSLLRARAILNPRQNLSYFSTSTISLRKKRIPTKTAKNSMGESGMAIFFKIHKIPEFKNEWIENNSQELNGLSENEISRKYDLHLSAIYKAMPA